MNLRKPCILIFVTLLSFGFNTTENILQEPFAVVELFTSEGCSSCPAADELLQEMSEILRKEGKNVIGLSFHVTYWDKLGWKDPYSNEAFTERQKRYVEALDVPRPYTPQGVVNGQAEFVGSNPFKFRELVTEAMSQNAAVAIEGSAKVENSRLALKYTVSKMQSSTVMNIAIVENDVDHFVPRGENKSKTLRHFNVVRDFSSKPLKVSGEFSLDWPKDLSFAKSTIVLYAQNTKSLKIIGVKRIQVKPESEGL